MANLNESDIFSTGIYQLEITDPVLGGPNGIANQQAKDLANRTVWLKKRVGWFSETLVVTENHSINTSHVGKTILLKGSGGISITLPAIAEIEEGQGFAFLTGGSGVYTITGGTFILGGTKTSLYLYQGESVYLIRVGSEWVAISASESLRQVGDVTLAISQPGTVIANGALLSRALYPRLWQWVQSLGSSALTTEALFPTFAPGMFTTGDGSTTFRVPDLRGQFLRAADNSKGVDVGRFVGTLQADEIKSHTHGFAGNGVWVDNPGSFIVNAAGSHVNLTQSATTLATGGTETRPKNIAYNPLIRF